MNLSDILEKTKSSLIISDAFTKADSVKKLRCNQMPNLELYPSQIEALKKMHNGCVLVGGTGSR